MVVAASCSFDVQLIEINKERMDTISGLWFGTGAMQIAQRLMDVSIERVQRIFFVSLLPT